MVGFFQKLINTFRSTAQAVSTAFGGGDRRTTTTDAGRRRTTRRQPTPSPTPSPTQQVTTIEQAREISAANLAA